VQELLGHSDVATTSHAPLIARKGSKKVWHFAHDSRSEITTTLDKCTYSFFVSARMMALQLIGNDLAITLPALEVKVSEHCPMTQRFFHVTQVVTEQRQIVLNNISIDAEIASQRVDVLGYVSGYPLGIVFSHTDRTHALQPGALQTRKAGVIEISFEGLKERFHQSTTGNASYIDVLKDYIANDIESRQWIFHPRYRQNEILAFADCATQPGRVSATRKRTAGNAKRRSVCRRSKHLSRVNKGIFQHAHARTCTPVIVPVLPLMHASRVLFGLTVQRSCERRIMLPTGRSFTTPAGLSPSSLLNT